MWGIVLAVVVFGMVARKFEVSMLSRSTSMELFRTLDLRGPAFGEVFVIYAVS